MEKWSFARSKESGRIHHRILVPSARERLVRELDGLRSPGNVEGKAGQSVPGFWERSAPRRDPDSRCSRLDSGLPMHHWTHPDAHQHPTFQAHIAEGRQSRTGCCNRQSGCGAAGFLIGRAAAGDRGRPLGMAGTPTRATRTRQCRAVYVASPQFPRPELQRSVSGRSTSRLDVSPA